MERVRKPGAKWSAALVAACFAAACGIGTAQAAFVIGGNNPQTEEQNVLLNTGATGLTIVGTLNQTGDPINFTGNVELTAPANGQARIEGAPGFTSITVAPQSATATFQDVIANIILSGTGQRSADIEVNVNLLGGGTQTFTTAGGLPSLGTGQNFFTVVAGPGEQITSVQFEITNPDPAGIDIDNVQQIRVSGFQDCPTCPPARVPEPGTLAVLGGSLLGFVGLAARRQNRR